MHFTHKLQNFSHPYTDCADGLSPARIAIIDPCRIKAEMMQLYAHENWSAEIVALEDSGIAGIVAVARAKPEVVLVSAHLEDLTPWDFIEKLKAAAPKSRAILLMGHYSEYVIQHAGLARYHGIICEKDEELAAIGQAIEQVRNGLRVVSAGISEFQNQLRSAHDSLAKLLTDRHFEVLTCITHSLSDAEIATHLGCSPNTARGHRQQIMRKLNIRSTPKLMRYGLEKGFGSVPLPQKRSWNCGDTAAVIPVHRAR